MVLGRASPLRPVRDFRPGKPGEPLWMYRPPTDGPPAPVDRAADLSLGRLVGDASRTAGESDVTGCGVSASSLLSCASQYDTLFFLFLTSMSKLRQSSCVDVARIRRRAARRQKRDFRRISTSCLKSGSIPPTYHTQFAYTQFTLHDDGYDNVN